MMESRSWRLSAFRKLASTSMVNMPVHRNLHVLSPPVRQYLYKRPRSELVHSDARSPRRLVRGDRTAVDRPDEEVQQALPSRGVVEYITDQCGASRLLDKVAETLGRRVETLEKKCEHSGVSCRQLSGMKIPSLIEGVCKRVPAMVVVQFPRAVNSRVVFPDLLRCQLVAAMRCDRHDIRGTVREPNAGTSERNLHEAPGKIARRVEHVLIGRRDL